MLWDGFTCTLVVVQEDIGVNSSPPPLKAYPNPVLVLYFNPLDQVRVEFCEEQTRIMRKTNQPKSYSFRFLIGCYEAEKPKFGKGTYTTYIY